jgi:hypothetical protein
MDDRPNRPPRPWEVEPERPPFFRRPLVRYVVTAIAVGSFVILTVVSSCGPRRTIPIDPPTTTTTGVTA